MHENVQLDTVIICDESYYIRLINAYSITIFKLWRFIFMGNKKYTYNYDIEECNQLFKRGIFPIGCGKHDKTGNVFHVFCVNSRYLKVLDDIRLLASQGTEKNRAPR